MKKSFFNWIFEGVILSSILPVSVILSCVYFYFGLQLEVGADNFFNRSQAHVFRWEQQYADAIQELNASLLEASREFSQKAVTPLHSNRYQPLKQILESSVDDTNILKKYTEELAPDFQQKFLLGLRKIRKKTLANFSFLDSEDLYLQFFAYDVIIHYAQYRMDIPSSLAMNTLLRADPQQNQMMEFLFANFAQFIIRNKFGQNSAKVALEALKYNFDFDHEKLKMKFEQVFFRPLAVEAFVRVIPLTEKSIKSIGLNHDRLASKTHVEKLPRGVLAICVNIQSIFAQTMNRLASQNPLTLDKVKTVYKLHAIASDEGLKRNPFEQFNDIKVIDAGSLQTASSPTSLWEQLSKDRRTIKFSYTDEEGKPRLGFAFPDNILRGFVHFFSVSEEELINSQHRFTLILLAGMILMLGLFLAFATLLARGFSKPLQEFTQRVTSMTGRLEPQLIEDFSHKFVEFGIMRSAFLSKVRNLARRFQLAQELSLIQSCIQQHPDEDDFKDQIKKTYERCFGLNFSHYDTNTDSIYFDEQVIALEQTSNFDQIHGAWFLRTKGEEMAPFHEQVRFFYESQLLEQQYKSALKTEQEFLISRQIQKDLLPRDLPTTSFLQSIAYFEPARTLGGDFFDYHQVKKKDMFVIADVSGKGLGAALYAAFVKAILHVISHTGLPLNKVLSNLHENLEEYGDQGFFCTLFLMSFDSQNKELAFASAGHNRMLLVQDHGVLFLSAKGLPVGILSGPEYSLESASLKAGDLIFLYTDGLTELESTSGELLGEDRLVGILCKNRRDTIEELRKKIVKKVHEFSGNGQLSDDVTFLIIKVNENYGSGN